MKARPPQPEHDTAQLVAAAVQGDAVAINALVSRLRPVVWARVRRRLGASQRLGCMQAPDLVQEIWFVLFKNDCGQIRSWDPSRGASLEGYVGMVVDREIGNLRSQSSAKKRAGHFVDDELGGQLADAAHDPEHLLIEQASAQRLWSHLMGSLPLRGRDVLVQLCFEHSTPEQAACTLGVDRQVVYNWRHEIRKRTRHFLSRQGDARLAQRLNCRS